MEVLANAAVCQICKVVEENFTLFQREICQRQQENRALRKRIRLMEIKLYRRNKSYTASTPKQQPEEDHCPVKVCDNHSNVAQKSSYVQNVTDVIKEESVDRLERNAHKQGQTDGQEGPEHQHQDTLTAWESETSVGQSPHVKEEHEVIATPTESRDAGVEECVSDQQPKPSSRYHCLAQPSHNASHQRTKPYSCQFCSKAFSFPKQVEIHQRVHTGEKPYSCAQCAMCFAHAGNLKRHQRVHTGEKPFSCTQCDKRFSHLHQLKMHQRVHSGERPHACPHCGRRFAERSYLRIHLQRNHLQRNHTHPL